jgi:hypothetical protein
MDVGKSADRVGIASTVPSGKGAVDEETLCDAGIEMDRGEFKLERNPGMQLCSPSTDTETIPSSDESLNRVITLFYST